MTEEHEKTKGPDAHFLLRRQVLGYLYQKFQENPFFAVAPEEICDRCETDPAALNWNLVYLEMRGLVEISKSTACPPHVAAYVSITADGIDLMENPGELDLRFPTAQSH